MKKIYRIWSIVLALTLLLAIGSPAVAAEGESVKLSMSLSHEKVSAGDLVSLTVRADRSFSTRGSGVTICYDPAVLALDLNASSAASPLEIHGPMQIDGKTAFRISFIPGEEAAVFSAAQPLAVVKFRVLADSAKTQINMSAAYLYDGELKDILVQKAAGVHLTVEPAAGTGYIVQMPADVAASIGTRVQIPVVIRNEDDQTGYNAFDIRFAYDGEALKLTSTQIPGVTVKESAGQLHVLGYGDDRSSGSVPVTLEFEVLRMGTTEIRITSARVDNSGNAVVQNASPAELADDRTAVTAGDYPVTLPDGFSGGDVAAPGEDYTFCEPADHFDYTIMATVNGTAVELRDNNDGTYTIPGGAVTGSINITATKSGKIHSVTLGADMQGETTAQYMVDYVATLDRDDNFSYCVQVYIDGNAYTGYGIENDCYRIPGSDIVGKIVFLVTKTRVTKPSEPTQPETGEPTQSPTEPVQKPGGSTTTTKPVSKPGTSTKPQTMHSVTFSGSGAGAAQGNAAVIANGKDYTLTLTKQTGFSYRVSYAMDGKPSVAASPNKDGSYTIKNVTGPLKIIIEKIPDIQITVHEYLNLDGQMLFLVLVHGKMDHGMAYAYDGSNMFWSDRYQAYAWLLTSMDDATDVLKLAQEKVSVVMGNPAADVQYSGDVNQSRKADLADAQLVVEMYNARCALENQGMLAFLNADVNADQKLDIRDAAAVIQKIGR